MDDWATEMGRGEECLAQIGAGGYKPKSMRWQTSLSHTEYASSVKTASVVVSHAGMGSVITAMRENVPIVMLPRRFEAGEHTTDHQMATARWLEPKPGVFIAWDEADLVDQIAAAEEWNGSEQGLSEFAPQGFTDRLKQQLETWTAGD